MRASIRSLTLALMLVAATWVSKAQAGIVQMGSTFDMRFFGAGIASTISLAPIVFDGLAQNFTVNVAGNTRNLSVIESDTDLGSGSFLISILLSSDGALFPGVTAFGSTGNNDPFNLLASVRLDRAVQTMTRVGDPDLVLDFTAIVNVKNPWNGSAPVATLGVGFTGLTAGTDIRSIRYDLYVSRIPEPSALALVGLALGALGATRMRSAKARTA